MKRLTTKKDYDKAMALGHAHIDQITHWCYDYLDNSHHSLKPQLIKYYSKIIKEHEVLSQCPEKYQTAVIITALTELTYPRKTDNYYNWSNNQRADFAGIPSSTYSDNQLSKYINFIIDEIRSNAMTARGEIKAQL